MKTWLRTIVGVAAAAALIFAYTHRESVVSGLSSLRSSKKTRLHASAHAKDFNAALDSSDWHPWLRAKISWDLWCIQMSADISSPKKKDGYIFFVVDATDRTDVRFVYVFDSEGRLVEIASVPLA